ncbi:CRISPR-associated ring nuclease Csm6 [Plesiomonas shigelloides]|uniref:CRISPR-associated ring nuclease Csm6 n=1 Tax=Plesiomonas shigelloides TaxID=703 RepID=UPI0030BD0D0C
MDKKNTLLAVTGMSPQVVTETLYGIHKQGLPWPNELIILTTLKGQEQARLGLCHVGKDQTHSMLDKCCIDLQRPKISNITIEVVPDHYGNAIDDARTKEDQEALADFIVKKVAHLCNDPLRTLHASLAGGRKTMTFFLGYAMTLFARPHDRLSHVLISPSEYEGLRSFYYPTPYTNSIEGKGANQHLDTHEDKVSVMLADIPFIRQRNQLEKKVLSRFSDPKEQLTYRQLVNLQQIASSQDPYNEIHLEFDLTKKVVALNYNEEPVITIDMSKKPLELAYYAMTARNNSVTSKDRFHRKKVTSSDASWEKYRTAYLKELWQVEYPEREAYNEDDIFEHWLNISEQEINNKEITKTLDGLKTTSVNFFDDRKKILKKLLTTELPEELVSIIEPAQAFLNYEEITGQKTNKTIKEDKGNRRRPVSLNKDDIKKGTHNGDDYIITTSELWGLNVSSNLCPKDPELNLAEQF